MFGQLRRWERRIRQRGHPARATIVSAVRDRRDAVDASGRASWELRLHVVSGDGEVFDAGAEARCPAGDVPAVGAEVDVLHDPGNRRRVLLNGPVATAMSTASVDPPATASSDHEGDPPDPLTLVRDVLDGLRDGTTLGVGGLSSVNVTVDATPVDIDAGAADPMSPSQDLTGDELKRLAQTDPAGLARGMIRRFASGEMSLTDAMVAKEALSLDGRTVQRIIREVTTSGSLSPETVDAIRRAQRDG